MQTTKLIYVIDDNSDYRFLVSNLFDRILPGYQLRVFDSGDELVHHLFRGLEKPCLIVLDHHMPGRNGYKTLELIKKHPDWQVIPVIMLSSEASPQQIKNCYKAGANSFLHKPLQLEELQGVMTSLCHYWLDLNKLSV